MYACNNNQKCVFVCVCVPISNPEKVPLFLLIRNWSASAWASGQQVTVAVANDQHRQNDEHMG